MSARDSLPPYYLGIDLGGTNIKSGVVDDTGRPLSSVSVETEAERGPEVGLDEPGRGRPAGGRGERAALGRHRGRRARLAGDDGHPGRACSSIRPTCPAGPTCRSASSSASAWASRRSLQNDANAAAYGEYWAGAGGTRESLVLFTLGTGIGCGIVDDGRIIEGRHSHGAECGHIIIQMDNGRLCSCGEYGHLEAYASATALVKRAEEALEHDRHDSVLHEAPRRATT